MTGSARCCRRKNYAIKRGSGNVEVQWNNSKKCVLDTMSDLVGKFKMKARKPWTTEEGSSNREG
jgi:hypothetical protein